MSILNNCFYYNTETTLCRKLSNKITIHVVVMTHRALVQLRKIDGLQEAGSQTLENVINFER